MDRLYAGKYTPKRYRDQVHGVLKLLRDRYGLHGGRRRSQVLATERAPVSKSKAEDQTRFSWSA